MINKDILSKTVEENLEIRINKILESKGFPNKTVRNLFRFISKIFSQLPPEIITCRFKVILFIEQHTFDQKEVIHIDNIKEALTSECSIIMHSENSFIIEKFDVSYNEQAHISYIYQAPLDEQLYIADEAVSLPEYYDSATSSIFAYPVYKELDEALNIYDKTLAHNSTCGILKQIWRDETKKDFCEKPEHFMRDSLWQYLRSVLRNHTVKREQIVDDSHPVDIKVTWPIINNVALIEIKWLGNSGTTKYRDARANSGAKQLIDYLSSCYEEEPYKNFIGYLAVFDGRRGTKCLNQYQEVDIKYNDEYISHPQTKYLRFYLNECN